MYFDSSTNTSDIIIRFLSLNLLFKLKEKLLFDENLISSKFIFSEFNLIKLSNLLFNFDFLFSIFPSTKISFLFFFYFYII